VRKRMKKEGAESEDSGCSMLRCWMRGALLREDASTFAKATVDEMEGGEGKERMKEEL